MRDGYPLHQVVLKRGQTILWLLISIGLGFLLTKTTTVQPEEAVSPKPVLNQEITRVPAGEIYGSIKIGQSFVSPANNLYRIDILLATYARENDRDVIFHLRHTPRGEDLATIRFNASQVKDNSFYRFEFPLIANSAGHSFYFFLESPDSEPGNAITIWGITQNIYKEGKAYRDHSPAGGDLAFRVYAGEKSLWRASVWAGEIYGSIKIGQSFVSPANNLYRIDILLATYARENDRDVIFHLRHTPRGEDLATIRFNASQVKDNSFYRFEFPLIANSAGHSFYFFLESPDSEPGNAITVWDVTDNVYKEGKAYRNHSPAGGDLAFRVYAGERSLWERTVEYLMENAFRIIMFLPYFALCFCLISIPLRRRKMTLPDTPIGQLSTGWLIPLALFAFQLWYGLHWFDLE